MALAKTIYLGPFVHSKTLNELDICTTGAIGVDESGKISFIDRDASLTNYTAPSSWSTAKIIRITDTGFFFPGFIDTHTHAPQYPNAGIFGSSTLLDWLETYTFPTESSFSSLDTAQRIYTRVVSRLLSHGTTTAAYYATTHVPATNLLADICLSKGQRALVGRVCMDQLSPTYYRDSSPETAVADTQACLAHVSSIDPTNALITSIITPRFAPSCSATVLSQLGSLAATTGAPIQTHISENTAEIALVQELFPDSTSYADVCDTAHLLTPRTILAHAVHLTPSEIQLIKTRGSKIAHCPCSNTCLTSGAAPVRNMLDAGLDIGLGTDVSGGYSPSILEEVRQCILVSRHVAMQKGEGAKLSVAEALFLATRGGAAVVGMAGKIGGFEEGMEFDAQMVRLGGVGESGELEDGVGPVDVFGKESWEDRVAKWVFNGDDRNTVMVWVRGRLVYSR
ncbi:hypothetical protein MBLNU457_6143t1 [Dothideomycetes sp. NU457]